MPVEVKPLALTSIRTNGGTQTRVALNAPAVREYGEAMTDGAKLPPVTVFFDGTDHWLADGFHRVQASMDIGALSIDAEIRPGNQRDARLYSVGANAAHGLRRTNDDKRRAVSVLLEDAEWKTWSDRKIGEVCGVSGPFVAALRRPEMAERQAAARTESAAKKAKPAEKEYPTKAEGCNPIAPTEADSSLDSESSEKATPPDETAKQPGPVKASKPPDAVATAQAEAQEQSARAMEVLDQFAQLQAEVVEYGKIFDADDKLAEAQSCIKRQAAEILVLRSRLEGLMNEKNEAVSAAKAWRRKHDALEKRLKAEAS